MYVTGTGKTKYGITASSMQEMAYEAMQKALDDASMSIDEINAIYVSNFLGGPLKSQLHFNSVVSSLIPKSKIPIIRVETACASGGSAVYSALMSLSRFRNVMVLGIEKMSGLDSGDTAKSIAMAGDRELDQSEGLIFPASYALIAQQHMQRYGTSEDDLAKVSLKNHSNANLNPLAHFYSKKVDMDMIKKSPVVSSPLRLFDCSPISDGSAAVILTKKRRKERDIKIIASELATDCISLAERKELTTFSSARTAAANAYKSARILPKDIDIAQVHDCFTIAELVAMEDLGFSKKGRSKDLVRIGATELSGTLPINTDGGLKAGGHPIGATGVSQICELVTQLRSEAGARQVDKAKIGLAHNIGGVGGTASVHILHGGKR